MWWLWPHLRRVWAGAGAILAGLTVTYLYSLLSEQALPHLRVASKLSHDYWPWLVTATLMLAAVSVFAERAHRYREARAPRPLRIARRGWRERIRHEKPPASPVAVSASMMVGRANELARLSGWFAGAETGARRTESVGPMILLGPSVFLAFGHGRH